MHTRTSWFEVDKGGLAKIREGVPKSALVLELIQNAWDTDATRCDVTLKRVPSSPFCALEVTDDHPEGFRDLSHAWTLFAESEKKGDATKRGRYNLGEKLVLALCKEAMVKTTKGTVIFGEHGTRKIVKDCTATGTIFRGVLRLTDAEMVEIRDTLFSILPPLACTTTYNGIEIPRLTVLKSFEVILPTVISDAEGNLRPTKRKCVVEIYQPQVRINLSHDPEPAMIYEMGIPVVETGDRWHYNIQQKVPLTLDRSNVTPAFLREVREAVAEAMLDKIEPDDAQATWVRVAAASPDASRDLVHKVFTARFGDDAVIYDPNDMEANKRAMNDGRTVVMGGHMSKDEWSNVRVHGIAAPAGKVYTDHKVETSPDGKPWTPVKNVTHGMLRVAQFARELARETWGVSITVDFVSEPTMRHMAACYGARVLRYNVGTLGYAAFEEGLTESLLDLTIHELAHEKALDHWSDAFYKACTKIGATAVRLALYNPDVYREAGFDPRTMAVA